MKKYKTLVYSQHKEASYNHLFVCVGFKVMLYSFTLNNMKVYQNSYDEGGVEILIDNDGLTSKTTRKAWEMPP